MNLAVVVAPSAVAPVIGGVIGSVVIAIFGYLVARLASSHRVDRINAQVYIEEGSRIRDYQEKAIARLEAEASANRAEIERLYAENRRLESELARLRARR